MTLTHFDLRKPLRRTGFRSHFLQNSKIFKISNKIYTNSIQLMRFDNKFLNCWNWFINSKIMTLLHFDLRKPVRCTGFRSHFLQKSKIFKINNKNSTNSFQLMRFDDKFLNCWNWFINSKIMTLLHFDLRKPVNTQRFQNSFFTKFKKFRN